MVELPASGCMSDIKYATHSAIFYPKRFRAVKEDVLIEYIDNINKLGIPGEYGINDSQIYWQGDRNEYSRETETGLRLYCLFCILRYTLNNPKLVVRINFLCKLMDPKIAFPLAHRNYQHDRTMYETLGYNLATRVITRQTCPVGPFDFSIIDNELSYLQLQFPYEALEEEKLKEILGENYLEYVKL